MNVAARPTIYGIALCAGVGMLDEGVAAALRYLGFEYRTYSESAAMTAKFSHLEVVTYIGKNHVPEMARYVNQQCVIVNPLGVYEGAPFLRYGVKFADGSEAWATESSLRKFRAPGDQVQKFRDELKQAGKSFGQIISECTGVKP